MCGIFGMIGSPVDIGLLKELGFENSHRGNQAFGAYIKQYESEQIIRWQTPYFFDALSSYQNAHVALFHLLSSTGSHKRIHPFEIDNLVFAHNGLLLDYKDFEKWSFLGPIDSQYLLAGISLKGEYLKLPEAIKYVVQETEGQQACWLYDKSDNSLYLWRVMSPLYIFKDESFIFSSVEFEYSILLEEGVVYCYRDNIFDVVNKFKYYSYVI